MYKKHLDDIEPYKPGKPIEEVKRELGLEKVIKLASNENPLGPPPGVLEAIKNASKEINRYPDGGCFYLKQALSRKLSVPEENFVFGCGSDEIIVLTLHAFVSPGDEVVVADPTFQIYHIASKVKGAELKIVPSKNFKYDLEGMLDAVSERTKVVFIANPDNPTGTYVNSGELDSFLSKLPKGVVVFIDEAYYEYARGGDYPETIGLHKRDDINVIIARTFSKAYALAGLRIGYGIARGDIAAVLNKVREPFNVNSIAQAAAIAALDNEDFVKKSVDLVKEEKQKLYEELRSLGVEYVPSKTNFVLVNAKRDSIEVFEYLLSKGIIVREMSPWGLKGFIRVNMGTKKENEAFLKAFSEAMKEIK